MLRFDTQAEHTIIGDPRCFRDGLDDSITLEIGTIAPSAGPRPRTAGCGTAHFRRSDGTVITIANAHLYEDALAHVVATRSIAATLDTAAQVLRTPDGEVAFAFDAGYCALRVLVDAGYRVLATGGIETTQLQPRHPAAVSAILATGIHFGNITSGPLTRAGMHELTAEGLALR